MPVTVRNIKCIIHMYNLNLNMYFTSQSILQMNNLCV